MKSDPTFDRVYKIAPHPMYTIGYAFFYGAALVTRSYVVLYTSIAGHLMQLGFLTRTPRGRCVTRKAYEHLGLSVPASLADEAEQLSLN